MAAANRNFAEFRTIQKEKNLPPLVFVDEALLFVRPKLDILREPRGRPRLEPPRPGIRGFTVEPYTL
jgi:hypothetical protein